jgi:hypothetical protein
MNAAGTQRLLFNIVLGPEKDRVREYIERAKKVQRELADMNDPIRD